MAIVANNLQSIISNTQKGVSSANVNLDDDTFSNLLDKQVQDIQPARTDWFNIQAGVPVEFQDLNGINIQDLVSSSNQLKNDSNKINQHIEDRFASSEMIALLTNPFNSNQNMETNNGLMNFAKRQAANFYNKCSSNVVTDLTEFVEDTLKLP